MVVLEARRNKKKAAPARSQEDKKHHKRVYLTKHRAIVQLLIKSVTAKPLTWDSCILIPNPERNAGGVQIYCHTEFVDCM
jgi:hypothetical protein